MIAAKFAMLRDQVHSISCWGWGRRYLDRSSLFVWRWHILSCGWTISFTLLLLKQKKVGVLLWCLQANSAEPIWVSWGSKIFHLSLVTLVAFSFLDLLIDNSLVLCSVIGAFISQIYVVCTMSRSSLIVRIVCLLTQSWLIRDVSTWCCGSSWNSLRMIAFVRMKVDLLGSWVNIIIWSDLANNFTDIRLIRKSL